MHFNFVIIFTPPPRVMNTTLLRRRTPYSWGQSRKTWNLAQRNDEKSCLKNQLNLSCCSHTQHKHTQCIHDTHTHTTQQTLSYCTRQTDLKKEENVENVLYLSGNHVVGRLLARWALIGVLTAGINWNSPCWLALPPTGRLLAAEILQILGNLCRQTETLNNLLELHTREMRANQKPNSAQSFSTTSGRSELQQ